MHSRMPNIIAICRINISGSEYQFKRMDEIIQKLKQIGTALNAKQQVEFTTLVFTTSKCLHLNTKKYT